MNQMMKKNRPVDLQTDCPCGFRMKFQVRKPKAFTPETTKVECENCKSIFLIKTKVGKRDRGVDIDIGVQELSPECTMIIQKALDEREKKAARSDEQRRTAGSLKVVEGGAGEGKLQESGRPVSNDGPPIA